MAEFIHGGPTRYAHQRRGLQKLLEVGGTGALLFEPGLGKTATVLDYASILALKLPPRPVPGTTEERQVREARVLVVAPLAAVDTWVDQAAIYLSPQVGYWAEVIGGSIPNRAFTLAARGGQPMITAYAGEVFRTTTAATDAGKASAVARAIMRAGGNVSNIPIGNPLREEIKDYLANNPGYQLPKERQRAWGVKQSLVTGWRSTNTAVHIRASDGPDGVDGPRVVLMVTNLDTFASRAKPPRGGGATMADFLLTAITRYNPDLMVIDESHKIKGHSSNVSRLMDRIGPHVPRRQLLTGTVMPAGPMDVYAQWRFLDPWAFGSLLPDGSRERSTLGSFEARFAVYGGWMGKEVVGFKNLDDLEKVMAERAVVAKKKDALDLPPLTETVVHVNLDSRETDAYHEMKKQLMTQLRMPDGSPGPMASTPNRLTQMLRLRQITAGHLPLDGGGVAILGDSKVQTIRSIVNDSLIGERRVLVFAYFTYEIEMLAKALAHKGTEIMVIAGDTPAAERIRMRKKFGSDDWGRIVLIAQVKTLSLAVNELITASNAVFASLSQQRDDLIQAIDRLNRIGQTKPMTIWYALAKGTIDEVILKSHKERTDLEAAVLDHIMKPGDDDDA